MSDKVSERAEKVFFNGRIYTLDDENPVVEALSTGGGRVLELGRSEEVISSSGPQAVAYDLHGLTVIPGLVDAHAHFLGYAMSLARLDLRGVTSAAEMAGLVADRASSAEPGEWIRGRGWDQNEWDSRAFPDRRDIDRASPENPVLLVRVCGHAALANSVALSAAGIGSATPDPEGGRIERDSSGEPTGILLDEAISLVRDIIPPPPREVERRQLREAAERCLAAGLTGVHDMGIESATARLYREMYAAGELPIRITAYYEGDAGDIDSLMAAGPVIDFAEGMFSITGLKFYMDGSLGARSAALLEDYSDDPGNRGILVTDPDSLRARIARAHRNGFGVALHAIGDRANRLALDIMEEVRSKSPPAGAMTDRIEHAQVVSPEDIPRFASLGVIPSMQFVHCTSDMPWAEDRLGAERLAGAYAWRSLLDSGCSIPGGSDFPVEPIDPFRGIYAAVTRMDTKGNPPGGWYPSQRLTVDEAVRSFTASAALAAGQEQERGSLAPGDFADLIVLSDDILECPPVAILDTEVLLTVLGGKIVYRGEGAPF